ncbi:hypothetical protein K9L97_05215 [Candidatus Woesearchaeota archaeon]|nr:hypothetical protein [Candidatus Woesearchaeota archaeon]
MKCTKCQKKATTTLENTKIQYCDKHFEELMEKRIRKQLRTQQKINTNKTYTIKTKNKNKETLLKHYLKNIFKGNLKLNKTSKNEITTKTSNEIANEFIIQFLKNKKQKQKNTINPFTHITEKELQKLMKIHKIKPNQTKKQTITEKLENKYPGTIQSTIKTIEFLKIKK